MIVSSKPGKVCQNFIAIYPLFKEMALVRKFSFEHNRYEMLLARKNFGNCVLEVSRDHDETTLHSEVSASWKMSYSYEGYANLQKEILKSIQLDKLCRVFIH